MKCSNFTVSSKNNFTLEISKKNINFDRGVWSLCVRNICVTPLCKEEALEQGCIDATVALKASCCSDYYINSDGELTYQFQPLAVFNLVTDSESGFQYSPGKFWATINSIAGQSLRFHLVDSNTGGKATLKNTTYIHFSIKRLA